MSLRSILGGSGRVRKSTKASSAKPSSPSSSATWANSLPRRKPGTDSRGVKKTVARDDKDDDLFEDKLDDYGLVEALATDLNLRDTSQAIHYINSHMFSPLPERAAGMSPKRIAEVLNYRKNLPPVVTVSHIQALLASPSVVEREIAELARSGFLRKIVVPRRGDIGETVMLASDYDKMVKESRFLDEHTKRSLLSYLKDNPGAQSICRTGLQPSEIKQLIHAGFLTSHYTGIAYHGSMSNKMNLYSRPEDKTTLTSLETVSRQPTGSLGTVGGEGAVHMAGGSGGGAQSANWADTNTTELKLAIPGNGSFLKLLSAALDHLVSFLEKSKYREAPETVLRDRWDGGIAKEAAHDVAKRSRGEFVGILPGQTRKWNHFYGLSFDWILQEAVGSGRVEVFETRSVGHGIRAI
ncbi:serine-threonine protein kinase 19-domain-containing protein [Camillea tinctor]|nr:serine-threonine protein kinase 19-domain-containing protein [Camillea tinctor]